MAPFHGQALGLLWEVRGHVPRWNGRRPVTGDSSLLHGVDPKRGASRGQPLASDWLTHAILSGLVASLIMLCGFMIAYGLAVLLAGRSGADPLHAWLYALTHNAVLDVALSNLYVAVAAYLVGGLLWAIVYARFGAPYLPGPHWWRGLCFGLLPAVVSVVVVLPLLGGGLLGAAVGAGPLPMLGNFLLHALYGSTLGLIYGPFGYRSPADGQALSIEQRNAMAGPERVALLTTLGGGLVGSGVGLLVLTFGGQGAGLLNVPPAAVLLTSVLGGIVCGLFVGSLIGQPDTPD